MSLCDQVEDAVAEGRSLSDEMRSHCRVCERCGSLTTADDALSLVVNPSGEANASELPAALREAMREEPRATPFSFARRAAVPVIFAVVIVALAFAFKPRSDLAHRAIAPYALGVVALFALVFGGVTAALHRGARGIGLTVAQRSAFLAVAAVVSELAVAASSSPVEGAVVLRGASVLSGLAHCASWGSLVGAAAGAALLIVARRTVVSGAMAAGAAAGAAAGLTGTLALHVVCPVVTLPHTMIAHVAPALLGAIVGALLGRRVLEA